MKKEPPPMKAIFIHPNNFEEILNERPTMRLQTLEELYEKRQALDEKGWLILDYVAANGTRYPWVEARADYFFETFEYVGKPQEGKFVNVLRKVKKG